MNYQVVIPAAGQGKRMNAGKNKQFIHLNGKPIMIHTLEIFEKDNHCEGIILVVNREETAIVNNLISDYKITKVKDVVIGGTERQYSVYNGLKSIHNDGIVLIHDGARPFVSHDVIHKLVKESKEHGAAIVAVPVKDTIKSVNNGVVNSTLERSSLWAVQTPQAFRLSLILKAHQDAVSNQYLGTDDASLIEKFHGNVHIVEGDYQNIKLTTQDDLIFAQAILERRKKEV